MICTHVLSRNIQIRLSGWRRFTLVRKKMNMWELVVCVAVAWGGCVERTPTTFANKEFCQRALVDMKKDKEKITSAYCRMRS
jgi:hypothetical protein